MLLGEVAAMLKIIYLNYFDRQPDLLTSMNKICHFSMDFEISPKLVHKNHIWLILQTLADENS